MGNRLSVLTAVAPERNQYLALAAASVAAARSAVQMMGWDLEWVVVVDGPPEIPVPAGVDQLRLSARRGVACARNTAQAMSTGSWVDALGRRR